MSYGNMEKIKDELYYQKLGVILQSIRQWQSNHSILLEQQYFNPLSNIVLEARKQLELVSQECDILHQIMGSQKDFLSSLKSDKNKQPKLNLGKVSQTTSSIFGKMQNNFIQKRDKLLELKSCIIEFTSSLNNQEHVLRKLYGNLQNLLRDIKHLTKELQKIQSDKFNKISIKKGRKQFDIQKVQEIENFYRRYLKKCSEIYSSALQVRTQMKIYLKKVYHSISTNFTNYQQIYQEAFGENIGVQASEYFLEKLRDNEKEISGQGSCLQLDIKHNNTKQQFSSQLVVDLKNLCSQAVKEIAIRCWDINLKQSRQQYQKVQAYWTLDHKIIFCEQQSNILAVIDLEEVKLIEQDESSSTIRIKPKKKSNSMYQIDFIELQKKDEFQLHFEQMKQNL